MHMIIRNNLYSPRSEKTPENRNKVEVVSLLSVTVDEIYIDGTPKTSAKCVSLKTVNYVDATVFVYTRKLPYSTSSL